MPKPVIIDCDPGHDDAMALMLAVASPELDLVAVTTVAGNQTLDRVTANAIRVLDVVDAQHIPVAAGADRGLIHTANSASDVHGETGLDGPDLPPPSREPEPIHAVELMAQKLREQRLTLIPIGPLTNIALLLATHPELSPQIERIVIMGGAIGLGNVTPSAEFNVWADPDAAYRVFTSGLDITMVGLDVTHRAMLSAQRADALRDKGRAGAVVADLHGFYRQFHERVYGHSDTPVHDALAVAHVIQPDVITTQPFPVEIDVTHGPGRGRTVVDQLRRTEKPDNALVATDVDADAFIDLLTERIASLA
ncbi:nucleoside hydrolase [Solirubrobacter soli]|uniref:nucleoside hydrolase n=1 Tax=Solirubrobacter soli TaxID=363832 RepID=UPI00040FFAB1|nr:nucleoside hydrolase [Solirubrobacter soli]